MHPCDACRPGSPPSTARLTSLGPACLLCPPPGPRPPGWLISLAPRGPRARANFNHTRNGPSPSRFSLSLALVPGSRPWLSSLALVPGSLSLTHTQKPRASRNKERAGKGSKREGGQKTHAQDGQAALEFDSEKRSAADPPRLPDHPWRRTTHLADDAAARSSIRLTDRGGGGGGVWPAVVHALSALLSARTLTSTSRALPCVLLVCPSACSLLLHGARLPLAPGLAGACV